MHRYRALWFALWALFLFVPGTAYSAADPTYLPELQRQAKALALWQHPEWRDLVHYWPNTFGGYTSLADGPAFFNAGNGKRNPEAELLATLAAFFGQEPSSAEEQHPQCAFPARYNWLKEKLQFNPDRLPDRSCARFEAWIEAINPAQVTLVFPTAYMNSPSSMFGHSLIRIDTPNQTEETRLFSYGINYAAETDETNGLLFAILGLTGGYPGTFSIMPYYQKVKEYNDLENRDIWEYQLNFTPAEIHRLLEHAWELGPIHFDYFFFDENCSFHLLALLDVARPGMDLAKQFPYWAIPSDTLRAVLEQKGLLKQTVYRPSNLSRIQHRRRHLAESDQRLALQLAEGSLLPTAVGHLPEERQAQTLELAYDYLRYRLITEGLERGPVAERLMNLLRTRSRLPENTGTLPPIPAPVRPDQGHETARLAGAAGRYAGRDYLQISLRPTYHDLLDPEPGYLQGAQINFFDITARYYPEEEALDLQSFRVLDIVSLTPRDRFFKPLSWRVASSFERLPLLGFDDPELFFTLSGGAGVTYRLSPTLQFSAMLEGAAVANRALSDDVVPGTGPSLRLSGWPASRFKWMAESRYRYYAGTLDADWITHRLDIGFDLTRNLSLRLTGEHNRSTDESEDDLRVGLHWYF